MSDAQNSPTWQSVEATKPTPAMQDQFAGWLGWEDKFGEYGQPGFQTLNLAVTNTEFFGHNNPVDLEFHLLRGEDGLLLCINANYFDETGMIKPFIMRVHPDHQRKGIAKKVTEYSLGRMFVQQSVKHLGPRYGYTVEDFVALPVHVKASLILPDMFADVATNKEGASFVNTIFPPMLTEEVYSMLPAQND